MMVKTSLYKSKDDSGLLKEFERLRHRRNWLPRFHIDVVYVMSGPEWGTLGPIARTRLEAAIDVYQRLKKRQRAPLVLCQGNNDQLIPIRDAFERGAFPIDRSSLRLEYVPIWRHTLDQFTSLPADLFSKGHWLLITSFWHLPRVRRYALKHWPEKLVSFWTTRFQQEEYDRFVNSEIDKILLYSQRGDLIR